MSSWPPLGMASRALTAEVHDDLLDHAGIAFDRGNARAVLGFQGNVFAEEAMQHLGQVAQHRVQVQHLGLHDLFAAEHEQLPGQAGGAPGRTGDLVERLSQTLIARTAADQPVRVALDDREDVVEVVGHPGGQLADRLQLLRMPKLGFEVEPLGHVDAVAMHHLAGDDREERPGERPAVNGDFLAELALAGPKAFPRNRGRIRGQNGLRVGFLEALGHLPGSVVQIGHGAIGRQLHDVGSGL